MVKQTLHIALAFLLLVSVTGLTLHKHYCGDELTGIAVFMDSNDCHESSCTHCKDETVSCRLDLDRLSSDVQDIPEINELKISVIELLTKDFLTNSIPVQSFLIPVRENSHISSLHGIPMLQSFRC